MRIVDAQVHIWSSGTPTNPNHRQVERFTKDEKLPWLTGRDRELVMGRAVCAGLGWSLPA